MEQNQSLALALSGGGFRATLFHLGVLRYLFQTNRLQDVQHISAVSGGSIVAAHFVLNRSLALKDFDAFAASLIEFIQSDVRGRIVRRWPLISLVNWIPGLWWLTTTHLLRRFYSKELFKNKTLSNLNAEGALTLDLLVTSLSYPDQPAAFTKDGFKNFGSRIVETGRPDIGFAVAASSAVPVIFPPLEVSASSLRVREKSMPHPSQFVTDGGVFDNLGLRPLRMAVQAEGRHQLIVSDAGATSDWSPRKSFRGMGSALRRMIDILFDRIRRLEVDSSTEARPPHTGHYTVSIHKEYSVAQLPWFSKDLQRNLPVVRTDLDTFSDVEIRALVLHGQIAAANELTSLSGLSVENAEFWDPIRGADFNAESLDGASRRSPRLLVKDGIYWIYLAFILLASALLWWSLRPSPYVILWTNLAEHPTDASVSNDDFRILKRETTVDLTHEVVVDQSLRDSQRLSPSVHETNLVVVKGESNPRYLVYEIISQRKQVEIACTSKHPYEVRYRQKDGIAGAGLSNIWTLIVDVGAHLPNIPFTVDLRVVRFNAYQAPNKNWVGVKVEDHEEVVKTHVILPRNHVLATSDLKVVSREVSSTSEAEFSGSNILPSPDSKSFTWTITKPEIGVIYKVYIDWEKNP